MLLKPAGQTGVNAMKIIMFIQIILILYELWFKQKYCKGFVASKTMKQYSESTHHYL